MDTTDVTFSSLREYAAATSAAAPVARERSAPATAAQRGLWLAESLSDGRNGYTVTHAYRLRGAMDQARLLAALAALHARHDALRTRFATRGGRLWQIVDESATLDYTYVDLRKSVSRRPVDRMVAEHLPEPLDLVGGPVFRAGLLALADNDHVLLLHIHHAVNDARSMAVLEQDLSSCYAGQRPEPATQFIDCSARLAADPAAARAAAEFWAAELAGAPVVESTVADRSYEGAWAALDCTAEYAAAGELAARQRVSAFAVLMTATRLAVAAHYGNLDTVIGTTVSARPAGCDDVVGPFVSTLPVRLRVDPEWTAAHAIAAQHAALGRVLEHHEVSFEDVAPGSGPGFAVPLTLTSNTAIGAGLDLPGLTCERLTLDSPFCQRDLAVYLVAQGEGHALRACRSVYAYSDADVRTLLTSTRDLLAAFVRDPERKLSGLGWQARAVAEPEPEPEPDATATLADVRATCADVLGVPESDLVEDFFDSGGGSITAMRLAVRLGISVRQVFRLRSMTAIACAMDDRRTNE